LRLPAPDTALLFIEQSQNKATRAWMRRASHDCAIVTATST